MEGLTHASELPDDSGYILAVQLFGPPKINGEVVWTSEHNSVGHTLISIGEEKFIYDSIAKGLRAIIKEPRSGAHLTDPFNTPICQIPLRT